MTRVVKTLQTPRAGRAPFVAALTELRAASLSTFLQFEERYLHAMWAFDALVVGGIADQGDIQNGKGDFLNDVLASLLEQCSSKSLHTRPDVPGLSFERNKLDVAYPATGTVQFAIETKATGIPRHPRNPRQPHPEGRAGSADLEKRIKEAAFKNIDIKAEAARITGMGGGATSDLAAWMRTAPPRCYMFISTRVRDEADLASTIRFGHISSVWFDACGLFCYGLNSSRDGYERKPVPTTLDLDRVLSQVCTALRNLP